MNEPCDECGLLREVAEAARLEQTCWEHADNCCEEWCDRCKDGERARETLKAALAKLDAVKLGTLDATKRDFGKLVHADSAMAELEGNPLAPVPADVREYLEKGGAVNEEKKTFENSTRIAPFDCDCAHFGLKRVQFYVDYNRGVCGVAGSYDGKTYKSLFETSLDGLQASAAERREYARVLGR